MNSNILHEILVLYTGFSENAVLIIPSDEFLCQFFCLFKFNLLCSLNINRILSIWRGLSPYLQLTACMCNGKECYRLELETTSGKQQTLTDVINKDCFNGYSSPTSADYCSSPPKSCKISSGHSSHSQVIVQDSEHYSEQPKLQQNCQNTYSVTKLESRIFNDSETGNEESTKYYFQYTHLFKTSHSLADLGMPNLEWLHYFKLLKL